MFFGIVVVIIGIALGSSLLNRRRNVVFCPSDGSMNIYKGYEDCTTFSS